MMIGTAVELARTGAGLVNTMQSESNVVIRRGVRIVGARHVVQAALTLAAPQFRPIGVVVDGLHALSMIGVIAAARGYRRPALTQAVVAATFAGAELWVLRAMRESSNSDMRNSHTRRRRRRR